MSTETEHKEVEVLTVYYDNEDTGNEEALLDISRDTATGQIELVLFDAPEGVMIGEVEDIDAIIEILQRARRTLLGE